MPSEEVKWQIQFKWVHTRAKSRLLVGTGKYRDLDETGRAIEASGADVVTMAFAEPI